MITTDHFRQAFAETVVEFRIDRSDDPTTAPMPDAEVMERATDLIVTTLFDAMRDTRLEALAERLAWGIVHSFHRVAEQLDGEADRAAQAVRARIRDADGSEVGTSELEEAQILCQSLDEASAAIACLRDHAAGLFHTETGRPWASPRGSLVSSKRTASVIAATDFLAARRQRKTDAHAPEGPIVLFSGGQRWEDYARIWSVLDGIKARVPTMILATTGQPKGCDAVAAAWAARSDVKLVAFGLDRRLGDRAGFVRNERMIALKPVEAVVCEGSGLQSHLARAVREARIPAAFLKRDNANRQRA